MSFTERIITKCYYIYADYGKRKGIDEVNNYGYDFATEGLYDSLCLLRRDESFTPVNIATLENQGLYVNFETIREETGVRAKTHKRDFIMDEETTIIYFFFFFFLSFYINNVAIIAEDNV